MAALSVWQYITEILPATQFQFEECIAQTAFFYEGDRHLQREFRYTVLSARLIITTRQLRGMSSFGIIAP